MATRFYLESTGTPGVTPSSWSSGWTKTTGTAGPFPTGTTKASTSFTGGTSNTALSGSGAEFIAIASWVSDPLSAQTISGTLKGQIRASENNGQLNATLAIAVKLIQADGTDRAVLLAVDASDLISSSPPELATSLRNQGFQDVNESNSLSLTSQSASNGDRIVIEVGYREVNTNTARFVQIDIGSAAGTDLAEDNTTTTQNDPWVEFSANITFQQTITGTVAVTQLLNTNSASGGVEVSGSSAVTQLLNTNSASGTVLISGTSAVTQLLNTSNASADLHVDGTSAVTQLLNTASASADLHVDGTSAVTQLLNTASASGEVNNGEAIGTVAVTQLQNTTSTSGTVSVDGTAAVTNTNTTSASGSVLVEGTSAVTQLQNNASGTSTNLVEGTSAVTQLLNTSSVTADLIASGTSAVTQVINTASASGGVLISGTAAVTEVTDICLASSESTIVAYAALQSDSDNLLAASGTVSIEGTASLTNTNLADGSGINYVDVQIVGNLTNYNTTQVNAEVFVSGSSAVTQNLNISDGIADLPLTGTIAVTQEINSMAADGLAEFWVNIEGTLVQLKDSIIADGGVIVSGSGFSSQLPDTTTTNGLVSYGILGDLTNYDSLEANGEVAIEGYAELVENNNDMVAGQLENFIVGEAAITQTLNKTKGQAVTVPEFVYVPADTYLKLMEIWQRLELDINAPVTVTPTTITVGSITQTISGNTVTRTGVGVPIPYVSFEDMVFEIWQRLGLDPAFNLQQNNNFISAGLIGIQLTVGTNTVIAQRIEGVGG